MLEEALDRCRSEAKRQVDIAKLSEQAIVSQVSQTALSTPTCEIPARRL